MWDAVDFVCSNCGVSHELPANRQNFLQERGCDQPPMFCDSCFTSRLKDIWEIPGEKRVAICASCGCEAKLQFVPCQDKPVFCAACYQKNKSDS